MNIGDTNEDGKLSATELGSLLSQIRALAPPEEGDVPRAPELFTTVGVDGWLHEIFLCRWRFSCAPSAGVCGVCGVPQGTVSALAVAIEVG